jgi:hypothetical protein
MTVTERVTLPAEPLHVRTYVLLTVSPLMVSAPEVDFMPVHEPVAVQVVVSVDDHVSCVEPLLATEDGFAANDKVGPVATPIVMSTERVTLPPEPLHVSVYVPVVVIPLTVWLSEVALPPDQAPEALHELALLEDQLRMLLPPLVTVAGAALNDKVGVEPPEPGGGLGSVGLLDDPPPGEDEPPTPPLQAVRRPSRNRPSTAWRTAHVRCRRPRKKLPI